MLPKKYRLKGKRNFDRLYKEKGTKGSFFVVKKKENRVGFIRAGVVVSLKVSSSAVLRNKIRRRVSSVLKCLKKSQGADIVIIALPDCAKANFEQIKKDLTFVFKKAGLTGLNEKNPN